MRFLCLIPLLALGACATGAGQDPTTLINALANAGCKTTINVNIGGSIGQLGGAATNSLNFSGTCDPSTVTHPVVALPQVSK